MRVMMYLRTWLRRLTPTGKGPAAAQRRAAKLAAGGLGPGLAGAPGLQHKQQQHQPAPVGLHSQHLLRQLGSVCCVGRAAALRDCNTGVGAVVESVTTII